MDHDFHSIYVFNSVKIIQRDRISFRSSNLTVYIKSRNFPFARVNETLCCVANWISKFPLKFCLRGIKFIHSYIYDMQIQILNEGLIVHNAEYNNKRGLKGEAAMRYTRRGVFN